MIRTRHEAPDTIGHGDHWRTDANCRRLDDPDVMFPDHNAAKIAYAKKICRGCPVWRECLDTTMRAEGSRGTDHRWGVAAGLTEAQRVALYKKQPSRWVTPKPAAPKPKAKPKPREPVRCGTRRGYRKHRAAGEDACGPCRDANTAADRRLRETGTTKTAA